MNGCAVNTPYRKSQLYCLRLGLIIGGVFVIGLPSEQVEAPPPEIVPAGVAHSHHFSQGNFYLKCMAAGDAHCAAKKYRLAEQDYAAALEETNKFNAAPFCVIDTMQSLANVYLYEKKYKKAVVLFEKIEALSEKTLPEHDLRLTETLLDLAVSYTHNKQPVQAEATFKRIIAIWEQAPAGWEINLSISVQNLATFYVEHGRPAAVLAVLAQRKPGSFKLQIGNSEKHDNDPYQNYLKLSFAPDLNR